MGNKEYSVIFVAAVLLLVLMVFNYSKKNERQLKIEETKKNLIEIGKQVELYYSDDNEVFAENFPPLSLDSILHKTWDFTQKQPNWILLPKPDYNEQNKNGLDLRINSSQTVSLSNNKDSWDPKTYKNIAIECGPIFEKVEVSVTLINESGDKINISEKLILKEGPVSLLMGQEKTLTGKIKELQLSIKNTNSRNMSIFNIKKITLSPF